MRTGRRAGELGQMAQPALRFGWLALYKVRTRYLRTVGGSVCYLEVKVRFEESDWD